VSRAVRPPLVLGVLIPLVVLAALAAGAHQLGEGLPGDGVVVEALNLVSPISDEDIHIETFVDAVTLAVVGLTAVVVLALVVRRRLRAALFVVAAIGGAVLLSSLLKDVVERPQIEGPGGEYSFPSGSAAWSMANAAALVLVAGSSRERTVLAVVGAGLVALLGALISFEEWHYASDVLGGWCLALAWVVGTWLVLRRPRAGPLPARPLPGSTSRLEARAGDLPLARAKR
jgi:membrane-associated phospholipid phosphatase